MSSTSAVDGGEAKLRKFWTARMVPAAERMRRRGVRFFAAGPDPSAPSYYAEHSPAASSFSTIEPEQFEELLKELWRREGHAELVVLAGPLLALAPGLAPKEEDAGDVSPFIYVMF